MAPFWPQAIVALCLPLSVQAQDPKSEHQLPNIVFILIDDWGWADASWHREPGYKEVQSPNMQALVESGIELDRNYVHKFCSPTRCSIQSGRNPIHVNAQNVAMTRFDPKNPLVGVSGIPVNMTGFAQRLGEAGYKHRVFAGKSDIGMAHYRQTPMGRGYSDALFYFNHDNDYWSLGKDPDDGGCRVKAFKAVTRDLFGTNPDGSAGPQYHLLNAAHCWGNPTGKGGSHAFPPNMTGCVYEDDLFTNFTVSHIMSHDLSSGPLLAFHASHSIHAPLQVVPDAYNRFKFIDFETRRKYLAMVWNEDRAVGRIVDALKAKNMYNNTLIVVSSDNGGPLSHASNYPHKGGKASNWEGGIRVNGFVSGGFVPQKMRGKKLNGLITGWDWYATFVHGIAKLNTMDREAAAAGLPPIDSVDQWPYLSGAISIPPRAEIPFGTSVDPKDMWSTKSNALEVRTLIQADKDSGQLWKLMIGQEPVSVWSGPQSPNASKDSSDAQVFGDCGSGCLFDLIADPGEHVNVAANNPEVVKEMQMAVHKHNSTVFKPFRPNALELACSAVTSKYRDPHHNFGWWGPFADVKARHYIRHAGTNCFKGHGAQDIDTQPVHTKTLQQCFQRCDVDISCNAIVYKASPGSCWKRLVEDLSACKTGVDFDTYVNSNSDESGTII